MRTTGRASERGFTLIELLVVVIIIGVLAGVAIPIFGRQQTKAHNASLTSDLHTAAKALNVWIADDRTVADIRPTIGTTLSPPFVGPGADPALCSSAGAVPWGNHAVLPTATMSKGTCIGLGHRTPADAITTAWPAPHTPNDFCLAGRNTLSRYVGGPGAVNYDKILFYDPQLGGVVTIDEIAEAIDDGRGTSCHGWGYGWSALVP